MPYKDPEAAREANRKSYRKRVANRSRTEISGRRRVTGGVITWEELQNRDKFKTLVTFSECTKKAKEFLHRRHIDRLAVAELAIRACEIKHGHHDKKRNTTEAVLTIKAFAAAVDIDYGTLYTWINIKTKVLDKLKPGSDIDFTTAQIVCSTKERLREGVDPVTAYYRLKDDPNRVGVHYVIRYLRQSLHALKKYGPLEATKEDVNEMKAAMHSIKSLVSEIKIKD